MGHDLSYTPYGDDEKQTDNRGSLKARAALASGFVIVGVVTAYLAFQEKQYGTVAILLTLLSLSARNVTRDCKNLLIRCRKTKSN